MLWPWWLKKPSNGRHKQIRCSDQIWRSGRDTTTTPATWSKPNHGQQGAHISRAGTWQCLRDLNKQSVNRAGPAPMARRLTFSVLFNPDAVQVNLSSLPTRPQGLLFRRKMIFRTFPETENYRFSVFSGFSDRKTIWNSNFGFRHFPTGFRCFPTGKCCWWSEIVKSVRKN